MTGRLCRKCSSRAVDGSSYCAKHQNVKQEQGKLYDRFRADDPIRALYRGKNAPRWQATRAVVLKRDILCVSCGHRVATECDHILTARVVVDNYGINAFYDPNRCQGLCGSCHSQKSVLESGWSGKRRSMLTELGERSNTTVVCGQAGSGKTTYVAERKSEQDSVWDYDVVMQSLTGLPLHHGLPEAIGSALAHRDAWIRATENSVNHCWLIVSDSRAQLVSAMRDAGARVIVMDTPDDVCHKRLRQRNAADNTQ
jgi:5-methylcytosine-specific restriction endonuclease McrA